MLRESRFIVLALLHAFRFVDGTRVILDMDGITPPSCTKSFAALAIGVGSSGRSNV
eukprot:CAMPEP_0119528966 /NCGR_PEP_ID=MMETSP1344-20130328/43038_1 /TAXON_ID=236787 /ORGANISM="Florenciella parvula, Strain CCMP2471" /LENGTH=55 /DNA_ID=CAMNT_0007568465 /DNA_START=165 /DNA_END=329 /DNA_ORIENTATION=-